MSVQNFTATSVVANSITSTGSIVANGAISAQSLETQGSILSQTSITAEYFYGNGAFLTGITGGGGGSGDQISSGFTKVYIPTTSGNVAIDVGLNTGMAVFTPSALILDADLSASSISGTISTPSQPNITQIGTLSSLSVTGDISGANLTLAGGITATGNSAVGNVTSTGNVTAQYFVGDGSLLTNISGTGVYGNTEVAEYLPTYTGNINPGNVNTGGVRANTVTTNGASQLTVSGNTRFQNNVTVVGSVTGNLNGNVTGTLTGTSTGTHNGLVYSFDIRDMSWDFGFMNTNAFTNPIQYLLAQTGNIDMGTFLAPSSLQIDTGTF